MTEPDETKTNNFGGKKLAKAVEMSSEETQKEVIDNLKELYET